MGEPKKKKATTSQAQVRAVVPHDVVTAVEAHYEGALIVYTTKPSQENGAGAKKATTDSTKSKK